MNSDPISKGNKFLLFKNTIIYSNVLHGINKVSVAPLLINRTYEVLEIGMSDKKTGLLNMSNHEAYLKEEELRKTHILDLQKKYPDLYKSLKKLPKDELIYLLFDIYIASKLDAVNASPTIK